MPSGTPAGVRSIWGARRSGGRASLQPPATHLSPFRAVVCRPDVMCAGQGRSTFSSRGLLDPLPNHRPGDRQTWRFVATYDFRDHLPPTGSVSTRIASPQTVRSRHVLPEGVQEGSRGFRDSGTPGKRFQIRPEPREGFQRSRHNAFLMFMCRHTAPSHWPHAVRDKLKTRRTAGRTAGSHPSAVLLSTLSPLQSRPQAAGHPASTRPPG